MFFSPLIKTALYLDISERFSLNGPAGKSFPLPIPDILLKQTMDKSYSIVLSCRPSSKIAILFFDDFICFSPATLESGKIKFVFSANNFIFIF